MFILFNSSKEFLILKFFLSRSLLIVYIRISHFIFMALMPRSRIAFSNINALSPFVWALNFTV
jgi:hypothetical protein